MTLAFMWSAVIVTCVACAALPYVLPMKRVEEEARVRVAEGLAFTGSSPITLPSKSISYTLKVVASLG